MPRRKNLKKYLTKYKQTILPEIRSKKDDKIATVLGVTKDFFVVFPQKNPMWAT